MNRSFPAYCVLYRKRGTLDSKIKVVHDPKDASDKSFDIEYLV